MDAFYIYKCYAYIRTSNGTIYRFSLLTTARRLQDARNVSPLAVKVLDRYKFYVAHTLCSVYSIILVYYNSEK